MSPDPKSPETIFADAIAIESAEDRATFLDQACQDDPALRRELETLVMNHFRAGDFLENPAVQDATLVQPITEGPGTVIGPYKLLQQIGEGGMGVVYMADQSEPVKRRVALKIIKPGMDTRQVIARFEGERQALAMMDHPNIARVFEAGTTETGRPYFVMELVKGVPITQYCDEHRLSPRQRLELFIPVCQAVQHAHQKGIIHRDIKPSNVMVAEYDDQPVPKVIDFGVAKAIDQRLTERTMFTQLGQVVGTIDYMSPEQAKLNQLDIDTRSDIYSLGVLLYELLTGETPFDRERLRSAAFDEMLRIIREEEPPKPSIRLTSSHSQPSIAANRHTEPKKLSTLVRGELDWIVMKALDKDRTRRYEAANGFAADVQRHLSGEAVEACPPSAAYRIKKFARRNKGLLSGLGAIGAVLLLASGISTWQAIRATRAAVAERHAHEEAKTAQEYADKERERAEGNLDLALKALDAVYLDAIGTEKLLGGPRARPGEAGFTPSAPPPLTALEKELLKRGLSFYDQFAQRNAVTQRAALQTAQAYYRVGLLQAALGDHTSAESAYRAAIERFTALAQQDPNNVNHHQSLADAHDAFARILPEWPKAKDATQAALQACTEAIRLKPNDAWLFRRRANYYYWLSDFDACLKDADEACRLAQSSPAILDAAAWFYIAAKARADCGKAQLLLEKAIAIAPKDTNLHVQLAQVVRLRGDAEGSLRHYSRAVELDPGNAQALYWRALARCEVGDSNGARKDVEKADALANRQPEHAYASARALQELGDYEQALQAFARAEEYHPTDHLIFHQRGNLHLANKQFDKALEDFNKELRIVPNAWATYKRRATIYFHYRQFDNALSDLNKSLELNPNDTSALWWIPPPLVAACPAPSFREGLLELAAKAVEQSPDRPRALRDRAGLYLGLSEWKKGQADLEKAVESESANPYAHYQHALLCLILKESPKYRDACASMAGKPGKTDDPMWANFVAWTSALAPDAVDDYAPVLACATKAVDARPDSDMFLNTLGAILYRAGRYEDAIEQLTELDRRLENPDRRAQSSPAYTWYFLAMAHHQEGHQQQANEYLTKANASTEQELADRDHPPAWNRRLTLQLFRTEAEALLTQAKPGGQPAPKAEKELPREKPKENVKSKP